MIFDIMSGTEQELLPLVGPYTTTLSRSMAMSDQDTAAHVIRKDGRSVKQIRHIESFPSDIDRDVFGNWLSGFTDGEGCFAFQISRVSGPLVRFAIGLRADDFKCLQLIQRYWQCGGVKDRWSRVGDNPSATFVVSKVSECHQIVVPHFEKHPLFAKKQRDFLIWKSGVELAYKVRMRPIRNRGGRGGRIPKWTKDELEHFTSLYSVLRSTRQFDSSSIEMPTLVEDHTPSLFDWLES